MIFFLSPGLTADFLYDISCFSDQLCDLIKLSCFYKASLDHPGAAACKDLVIGKILSDVLCADAACGHELQIDIGCCHGLDEGKAA